MTLSLPRWLMAIFTFSLLSVVGCSCGGDDDGVMGIPCDSAMECPGTQICVDGFCERAPDGMDTSVGMDTAPPMLMCDDGRDPCGRGSIAACCGEAQVCMGSLCVEDCGENPRCGSGCCEGGQECLMDRCVIECDEELRCGDDLNLCCDGSTEACVGGACVPLGDECALTEECELDEICEPTLGRCLPRASIDVCEFRPPPGEFAPSIGCRWVPDDGYDDVVMTPSVANLTDDNGDGMTNTDDIPDIAFIAFNREANGCCTNRGVLRIISGACNEDGTMNTLASLNTPFLDNSAGVALGNLHQAGDPTTHNPEIVTVARAIGSTPAAVVAYQRVTPDGTSWEVLWQSTANMTGIFAAGAQPSLADLDKDGRPEVIVGNLVLDGLSGEVIWDGRMTVAGGGVGNNAFLGPTSTIADIDRDGFQEVIAGNTVYDGRTGALEWSYAYTTENSACQGTLPCDGFNAVANMDDDEFGEVVIVRRGEVFVLEHDGELKTRIPVPKETCARNESGPPTIADFDNDGRPEIGTAGADYYVVIDLDCTGDPLPEGCDSENVRWKVRNRDCSSRATGSSVFDFDGDGSAEVVYADETTFRIFRGLDGEILYEDTTHSSNTRMEMPVVVDVDNDGKSEVVIPEPNTNEMYGGIEIWEDADNNWVRTRRIWNQHGYYVTNITEDGQVPAEPENNWDSSRLNNFRQNVQPGGLFDAPDLVITDIEMDECAPGVATIAVTVKNEGALGVAPGVPVFARATPLDLPPVTIGVERTTLRLLPGQSERVIFMYVVEGGFTFSSFTVDAMVDDDGMGGSVYNECHEDNNAGMSEEAFETCMLG